MPSIFTNTLKNKLLSAVPPEDVQQLLSDLHPVSLSLRQILYQAGAPIDHVFFIEQGVASILTAMADGGTVEVGMVGQEGMVGAAVLLGSETSAQQIIVQIPGTALRLSTLSCKRACERSAALRNAVHRFLDTMLNLSAQTAACNRLHSIEQRCARWLLMASDRINSDRMQMTHEFLSSMLGVRRVGVTTTLGELQRSGLVRMSRGELVIVDHEGLEAAACECYRVDRAGLLRLL